MQLEKLPASWQEKLSDEFTQPYFQKLQEFLETERAEHQVFPPEADVFNAFQYTPFDEVNVVILGQDPYHDDNQAHGLCFSVRPGIPFPPSLRNIFKELKDDVGCSIPNNGTLTHWAQQGVFLLNTVLTVRAHEANSHKKKGWEKFTDAVIRVVGEKPDPVIFVLWGKPAQTKKSLIDDRHYIIESAHPSPLSAKSGFFDSRPFSQVNNLLKDQGKPEIDWQIPNV